MSRIPHVRRRRIKDDHLDLHIVVMSLDGGMHTCKMIAGMPVYYFTVIGRMKRGACSQHRHGFKQVGLALGILPREEEKARTQGKVELSVISKIVQREVRKIHSISRR